LILRGRHLDGHTARGRCWLTASGIGCLVCSRKTGFTTTYTSRAGSYVIVTICPGLIWSQLTDEVPMDIVFEPICRHVQHVVVHRQYDA
jgi:hypothetical protein